MNNSSLTIGQLLEHPKVKDLVSPEDVDRIAASIGKQKQESKDPVYIRILYGIGAWFAAMFLIFFIGITKMFESGAGTFIWGIAFIAAAIVIERVSKAPFLSQLSLALVFAGNTLVLAGATIMMNAPNISVLLLVHAIVCPVVYLLYPNGIYRLIAPMAIVVLATLWIIEEEVFIFMHALIAAEMLLAGMLLLTKKLPPLLKPLVYSAAAMLPATLLFMNLTQIHIWRDKFNEPLWPSSILLAAGLIYLYFHLAGGLKRLRQPWLICAIASTVLLGIFSTPGILVAIGLLILGYAFGDRILMVLSYLFLPCFLVAFYYALNVDLAHKSWIIAGSGAVLLVVRWIVGRLPSGEVAE
ncbi:MAG: DUF4401 domain-containing protein [Planctomycetes bacterium]|nr:DUF4401 domain-containing protein [Planctomycetota bacterium]